jgi:hypothetical protein
MRAIQSHQRKFWIVICVQVQSLIAFTALANHGPATSGGGTYVISGETLPAGRSEFSVREDMTRFEDIDREIADRLAIKTGEFDRLESSSITSLSFARGISEDLQLGASLGYYAAKNFVDSELHHDGEIESGYADPEGLTDLTLSVKYRIVRGQAGSVSLLGGLIVPTGRDDVALSNGHVLEPSSQPGSDAWGYQTGVAYSRFITSRITGDASTLFTYRNTHDGFDMGDRADLAVALAYRVSESINSFPNVSLFAEANTIWLGEDEVVDEGTNENSGGWTTYVTPGVRVRVTERLTFSAAPSIPVAQSLNGEQIETGVKFSALLSYTF